MQRACGLIASVCANYFIISIKRDPHPVFWAVGTEKGKLTSVGEFSFAEGQDYESFEFLTIT